MAKTCGCGAKMIECMPHGVYYGFVVCMHCGYGYTYSKHCNFPDKFTPKKKERE